MPHAKIHFYKTTSDKEIVLNFIDQLDPPTLAKTRNGIRLLENYGLDLIKTKWIKKTKKTPSKEIKTAIQRSLEFL